MRGQTYDRNVHIPRESKQLSYLHHQSKTNYVAVNLRLVNEVNFRYVSRAAIALSSPLSQLAASFTASGEYVANKSSEQQYNLDDSVSRAIC